MEPHDYFTHFAEPEGGTRREWLRYHLGYRISRLFLPAIHVGEWGDRMNQRSMDWAERASTPRQRSSEK